MLITHAYRSAATPLLCGLLMIGCQTPPPREPALTGERAVSVPATPSTSLLPLTERSGAYQVTVGDKAPREVAFRYEPGDQPGTWRSVTDDQRVAHLQITPEGAIVMTSEEEHSEGVRVSYEPALLVLPTTVESGPPITQEDIATTVTNLSNGAQRDRGVTAVTMEVVGSRPVETPLGVFEAVVVRKHRRMKLGMAEVDVMVHLALAPGVGVVAESIDRTTRVIGMFQTQVREESRLLRSDGPQVTGGTGR